MTFTIVEINRDHLPIAATRIAEASPAGTEQLSLFQETA